MYSNIHFQAKIEGLRGSICLSAILCMRYSITTIATWLFKNNYIMMLPKWSEKTRNDIYRGHKITVIIISVQDNKNY